MQRWTPPVALSPQEKMLMKRLTRVRALFGFLRQHRHELFDDTFQDQLEGMYRVTGAGEEPLVPAGTTRPEPAGSSSKSPASLTVRDRAEARAARSGEPWPGSREGLRVDAAEVVLPHRAGVVEMTRVLEGDP